VVEVGALMRAHRQARIDGRASTLRIDWARRLGASTGRVQRRAWTGGVDGSASTGSNRADIRSLFQGQVSNKHGANFMAEVIAPGFKPVADAFYKDQAAHEGGAQLAIFRNGAPVLDVWAGRDSVNDRPYGEDTISVMMSCTKGAVAACAHMLAERGLLDFDAPVTRYWPQFAGGGKGDILVRHLFSHSAGLPGFEPEAGIGPADFFDPVRTAAAIEEMAPLWKPGEACAYHAVTFGILAGEVIRRVSGKSVGVFFAEEIAGPLDIEMWIGLPERFEPRWAPHFASGPQATPEQWRALFTALQVSTETPLMRTMLHSFAATEAAIYFINDNRWARAAEMPAGNGIGTARALAKLYAALIGEVNGVRLIRPDTMERARVSLTKDLRGPGDLAKLATADGPQFGLGFELPSKSKPMLGPGSFGHSGAGGRLGFAHPESGITVGYVCNAMLANATAIDPRWAGWTQALNDVVGVNAATR
jgi:CubicO group peptidase (beta-lactamase class C family)